MSKKQSMTNISHPVVILLLFLAFSCENDEKAIQNTNNTLDKQISRALLNGYYTEIDDEKSIVFYQNKIFLINKSKEGFSEDKFMFHLIRKDLSFENRDFFKEEVVLPNDTLGIYSRLQILEKNSRIEPFDQIRLGQFVRGSDNDIINLWTFQEKTKNLIGPSKTYKNELKGLINKNIIYEDFLKILEHGKFFKTLNGFHVLLLDDQFFLFANDQNNLIDKFMLHLVRDDNSFENLSFMFDDKSVEFLLEPPFNKYKIAKVIIPINETFNRIRIGQFNDSGNLWVKEFKFDWILSNSQLKYNNEFR